MSRKYRQRGYQDEEPTPRTQQPPRQRRSLEERGPGGRGLGAPTDTAFRCASCGRKQEALAAESLATCPSCGEALHSCVNCRHFDSGARWECRETIPERIPAKRKANACARFAAKLVAERRSDTEGPGPSDAKSAFDALFKGI